MAEEKNNAKEEKKEQVQIDPKFKDLLEKIESLTVLELSRLVKVLEDRFGVSASMFAAPATASGAGNGIEKEEEKSSFNVVLKSAGENKIQVIKAVKEITGKGLKESKDLVDQGEAAIKEGVTKEEAEELKNKLMETGATVELQ